MKTQDTFFTPGPWTVGKLNRIQAGMLILIGEREIAARPSNIPEGSSIERTANARLIAASPDLLDAAASAAIYLLEHSQDPSAKFVLEKLQSAIQKATKGTQ